MTIHHLRDYSANTRTAANNTTAPEAPIFLDVPEDWLDAAYHRVNEPAEFVDRISAAVLLIVVGVVFAVMMAVAVL